MDDSADATLLQLGETLIRRDLVNVNFGQMGSPRLCWMSLTSRRIILTRPSVPGWYPFFAWTVGLLWSDFFCGAKREAERGGSLHWAERISYRPSLGSSIIIELPSIVKIWAWDPRLSVPPMIQALSRPKWNQDAGYTLVLLSGEPPRQTLATYEEIDAHLSDIERAWAGARQTRAG